MASSAPPTTIVAKTSARDQSSRSDHLRIARRKACRGPASCVVITVMVTIADRTSGFRLGLKPEA